MKNPITISALLFASFLVACGGKKAPAESQGTDKSSDVTKETTVVSDSIVGYYVGDFISTKYDENKNPSFRNKISIAVDSISGLSVYGHSIVAGNVVAYIGTVSRNGDIYTVKDAKEQGSNKYNGVFNYTIDLKKRQMTGTWMANDKSLAVTECKYELEKRVFKYDPNNSIEEMVGWTPLDPDDPDKEDAEYEALTEDVAKFNASTTLLKEKDVANMYKGDLEVLRNSIYARHGYSFRNRRMRFVFDEVDWYVPVSIDVRAELTDIEKKNEELLKRYEDHAIKYYDYFGR